MKHANQTTGPLTITIDPKVAYISSNQNYGSYADLTVTINNSSSSSLSITGIAITLPDTLAPYSSLNSIVPVAQQSELWSFGPSGYNEGEFDAASQSGSPVPLGNNDQWKFILQNITLVSTISQQSVNVTALVQFDDGTSQTQSLEVGLEQATANIVYFNSQPAAINPGETAVLSWECTEINYVIIDGLDDTHRKASDTVNVSPNSTTIYTLYAYGEGVILSAQWGITVGNAAIINFGGQDGASSVNCGDSITLVWNCNQYTESITLTDNTGVQIPSDLLSNGNTLQHGTVTVGPVLKPTTFTFTAYGNIKSNYDQVEPTININDVSYNLTASPDSGVWEKDSVTLYWNIASATAVSIDPPVTNGPSLQNLVGSVVVNPAADITYTLSVSGFTSNQPAQYQLPLSISVQQVTINSFTQDPPQITPDAGANACTLNWSTNAQVVSINGTNLNPNSSEPLTAPPNGAVYTLTAGTVQNPDIISQPLTIVNSYGPFTFNNFQPDQTCVNGLDLAVTDSAAMAYLKQGAGGGYAAALTGVTITNNPDPTQLAALCVYETTDNAPYFVVLIWPATDTPLTMEWADILQQTGTITLLLLSSQHIADRELHARARRLKEQRDK